MNFESVHNYYERLVYEQIAERLVERHGIRDPDFLEDVACVALNRLPPRYVRHDVDMIFYLTSDERAEMEEAITEAVDFARSFVQQRRDKSKTVA